MPYRTPGVIFSEEEKDSPKTHEERMFKIFKLIIMPFVRILWVPMFVSWYIFSVLAFLPLLYGTYVASWICTGDPLRYLRSQKDYARNNHFMLTTIVDIDKDIAYFAIRPKDIHDLYNKIHN